MTDLLAIISKAQFEAEHRGAAVGDALGYTRYVSTHAALEPLRQGGSLFLVTVRPPDERLWLLAELRDPKHDGKAWVAAASSVEVRDISALIPQLRFTSGKGITAKKGALGMSLQTPRVLTSEDSALLRGGKAPAAKRKAEPKPPPEPKPLPEPKKPGPAGEGLVAALAEWRTTRAPELEALIITLGQHHARAFPPLDPEADDYDAQWSRRASEATPEGLDHLLSGLWSDPRGSIPMRVRQLLDLGTDPRLGEAFLRMIDDPPVTASSNFGAWTTVFKALPELVDTRATKRLQARLKRKGGDSQFWPKLNGLIERALGQLPEPAKLSKEQAASVAAKQKAANALLKGAPPVAQTKVKRAPAPMKGSPREVLEEALAAARAGKPLDALEPLRLYWVATHAAAAANLLTRLGDVARVEQPNFALGKAKEIHQRWLAAGKTFDATLVSPLLAALLKGTLSDAEERLEAMLSWPPDARVAESMINHVILGRDPYIGARPRLFKRAYELLVHNADPRFIKKVQDNAARLERAALTDRNRTERPNASRTLVPYVEKASAGREPSPDEAKLLTALEAVLDDTKSKQKAAARPDQELALLQAIAEAAPGDTTPYVVFADFLTERGDQRAEFINLCLEAAAGRPVKGKQEAWLRTHGPLLVGALPKPWKLSLDGNVTLGFLNGASLGNLRKVQDKDIPAMLEDPRWAAVKTLSLGSDRTPLQDQVLTKAPLLGLEVVTNATAQAIELMAGRELTWRVAKVELVEASDEPRQLMPKVSASAFPRLREVELPIFHKFDGSEFATPFLEKVTTLQIGSDNSSGSIAIDVVVTRAFENEALQTLEVKADVFDLVARRQGKKLDLALKLAWCNPNDPNTAGKIAALSRIPAALVSSITTELDRKDQPLDPQVQQLFDRALAHLPRA